MGGLLGGEDEAPELEASSEARAGADAFAAALAADQAKHDPAVAKAAERFLDKQSLLLDAQTAELEEQRALRLRHLQHQSREGKLRRFGQRIRNGMQVFTALAFTMVGVGLCVMVYDAFTARSVVVEAFDTPPALLARGLSGKVVAGGLLDELTRLQAATRTSAAEKRQLSNAWAHDIKVEVPETGISLGDVDRVLKARFGHDLHIEGDLVQTATGGLALTVRGDNLLPKVFTGGAADLDTLTSQAAEYIYGRSQPVQFSIYLDNQHRFTDQLAFVQGAFARATNDDERAELALSWAWAYAGLNDAAGAAAKSRLAMALKPPNWGAWNLLVDALAFDQGEEAAWRESQRLARAADRTPRSRRPPRIPMGNTARLTQDLPIILAGVLANAARNGGAGTSNVIAGPFIADTYARMHDPAAAARYMAGSDPNDQFTKAETAILPAFATMENRGDWAATVPALEVYWKAWLTDPDLRTSTRDLPCFLGLAYGMTDRMAEAEAVFKRVGRWSLCYALHGDALEHAGDLAGAERVWAGGLAFAPDMPLIYLHRGVSELNRDDLKAAETDLTTANAKAPHWADPLKAWGDVLARQSRWKEALAKYDAALKYAPAWAELHQARDTAARRA
jgi:tetratricopeptide (TPR) repeat protein